MQNKIIDALRRNAADEAVIAARAWVEAASTDAQAQRWLSTALRRQGDTAAARAAIEQAIALAPEDSSLHLERAVMLMGSRQLDEADAALTHSMSLNPNQWDAYLVQAQLALGRGDLDEAERLSRTAARLEPEHPQLAAIDGMIALRRGDADRALSILTIASQRAPDDPGISYALGFAYLAKQHWAFAEQAFRRVVECVPDTAGLRALIAQLAHRQGRLDDAIETLTPLLGDPASVSPGLHRLAGEYELRAGRPESALRHLREVLAVWPGDRRTLQALLAAWQHLDDLGDARSTLEAALAATADEHDLWLARLALETVASDAARAVVERWVTAMPEHIPAHEAQMRIHDMTGDAVAAEASARRIVTLEPGRFSGEERIVEALMARDPEAVVPHIEQLIAQAPQTAKPALRNWMGWIQDRMGRYADAVESWSALHREQAAQQLPLPAMTQTPENWPPLAPIPETISARPLFLWGAPGSGVERLLAVIGSASRALRMDRSGPAPPADAFQKYATAPALAAGKLDPTEMIGDWRTRLPERGIDDGNLVDWLLWWDNALLLALRPQLPEGRVIVALRDPRDMLLDWLAFGSPVPLALESPEHGAEYLAAVLEQIAQLHEQDLYPHQLIRLDGIEDDPSAIAAALGEALQAEISAPSSVGPARFPTGRWRDYADALTRAFESLKPVAVRFGYPEA
ncbi:MAG: tetratricopeptide repeat protein [Xanthomonadaceae bacterium]|nr:tetratricopeptide repeat protein [Xanthomonadaceae bacterium]